MRLLLDSQILYWWRDDSPRLTPLALSLLADPENDLFVSVATVWELAIKEKRGKLSVPRGFFDTIEAIGMKLLPVTVAHAVATRDLPLIHHDPFDRIIVAQARVEGLVLLTHDRMLAQYPVPFILDDGGTAAPSFPPPRE